MPPVNMNSVDQTGKVPLEKAPTSAARVQVAANAGQGQGLPAHRIELRNSVVDTTWPQGIFPDPEHLINRVQRIDFEFIVGVRRRNEHFKVIVFIDARIAL